MRRWKFLKFAAGIAAGLAFLALFSAGVMLLWNALVPALFQGPVLTFWQSAGLLVLARLLTGFRGRGGGWHGGHWMRGRHAWRKRMNARWESMSPDDREAFRQQLRARYGGRCGRGRGEPDVDGRPAAPAG